PGDLPALAREARVFRDANSSSNGNRDDGYRLGGVLCCRHSFRPPRYDEVHFDPDQLGRQVGQPVDPTLRISIVDDNILALNPSELVQPLPERVEQGRPIGRGRQPKETYPRHPARLLLRARRERPRSRAADQRDECTALQMRRPMFEHRPHPALLVAAYRILSLPPSGGKRRTAFKLPAYSLRQLLANAAIAASRVAA